MKTTKIPGFTAEDALCVSKAHYRLTVPRVLATKAGIRPQLSPWWPTEPTEPCNPNCVCVSPIGCPCCGPGGPGRGRGRGLGSFLSEVMAQEGGQGHEYETAHLARL